MFSLLHGRLVTCDQPAWLARNNKAVIIDEPPQFHPERSVASWTARPKPGILAGLSKRPDRAAVAQWIEYWPPKPRVAGSIPASRASSQGCVSETSFTHHSGDIVNTLGPDVVRLFRVECLTPGWVTLLEPVSSGRWQGGSTAGSTTVRQGCSKEFRLDTACLRNSSGMKASTRPAKDANAASGLTR